MSDLPVNQQVPDEMVRLIFEKAQIFLLAAARNEAAREYIQRVPFNPKARGQSLGKMCGKLLSQFQTQKAGGFEVNKEIARQEIEDAIISICKQFDGIVCGVEVSEDSLISSIQPQAHLAGDEVVLYNDTAIISDKFVYKTEQSGKQKMTLHALQTQTHPKIWLGHTSSGTSESDKSPLNRALFYEWIAGADVNGQRFDREKDWFFGDVNFDLTDNIQAFEGERSIVEQLQAWSMELNVQLIVPMVRVFKKRFANRPFANNQIHKGLEQIAESMVAVVPTGSDIQALDRDGLLVINNGQLFIHHVGEIETVEQATDVPWPTEPLMSFSEDVLLDHKPIVVAINGRNVQFHNFMDFKTGKGVRGESWYDQIRLEEQERAFVDYLMDLMSTVDGSAR